jgi:hypothetical protein
MILGRRIRISVKFTSRIQIFIKVKGLDQFLKMEQWRPTEEPWQAQNGAVEVQYGAVEAHNFFFFFVQYSALLHLPPLRFHCADGCWDRTQDRCNGCINSQTL